MIGLGKQSNEYKTIRRSIKQISKSKDETKYILKIGLETIERLIRTGKLSYINDLLNTKHKRISIDSINNLLIEWNRKNEVIGGNNE